MKEIELKMKVSRSNWPFQILCIFLPARSCHKNGKVGREKRHNIDQQNKVGAERINRKLE
jgi:hypothetical protein